jgi:hypothetical protein
MPYTSRPHSQLNPQRAGVFISYARSDGEAFAHRLRQRLEAAGISAWLDRFALEGGRDWWLQIEAALDQAEFLVLVVTPAALKSENVRKEWSYARQQGVCVYPIEAAPGVKFDNLPRWMRDAHHYNLGTLEGDDTSPNWQKFLNDLKQPCQAPRVPFMVEDLPEDFVPRPGEFDQLITLLLDRERAEPIAITAALRGAGGYGKTTLAKALCHDERVREAFDDGVLWVTLGENPGNLISRVEDLIHTLSGARPGFMSITAAVTRLIELLADRDILLVLDDVWNKVHLEPFLQGGPRCARLITTRNLDILPANAQQVPVDAMQPGEAILLLGAGLARRDEQTKEQRDHAELAQEMHALAARLGHWPLLVKLVNGTLHNRVKAGQPLREALAYVNQALNKRGLTFFDERNPEARSQAVAKTLSVSFEQLNAGERARFSELAVFPEDVNVPLATLEKYWGLDAFDTETLCGRFNNLSLVHNFELNKRTLRLHDVIRKYLMDEQRDRLRQLHNQLLDAHTPTPPLPHSPTPAWAALPEDEPYLWDHLAFHLIEVGRGAELVATVKDWRYLAQKTFLRKSLAVERDLLRAETVAPTDDVLRTLRRNFVNSGHLINHCATRKEVNETLFARLQHVDELKAILQGMEQSLETPYVAPLHRLPDLPHPALIRTLEGHRRCVKSCAFSPNSKLIVSASDDKTLKVWEVHSGALLRTLGGHSASVNDCAFSPDGELIVSASSDNTLKIWEAHSGELLRTLEGHSGAVRGCAFSPDGKLIVSASSDYTLKVWEVQTGEMLRSLAGHLARVTGCAFSPDIKLIVSASDDETLKVWDAETGQMLRTLEGHSNFVRDCAFNPDGKLVVHHYEVDG